MERPRVIVRATMAVDGRIAIWPGRTWLEPEVGAAWSEIEPPGAKALERALDRQVKERFGSSLAVLSGSGTFATSSGRPLPPSGEDRQDLLLDFLPDAVISQPGHQGWFIVTDSRGRVRWSITSVDGNDLLILVTHSTPADYLTYLRDEQICYLIVGDDRVDFGVAMQRLRSRLGVTGVLADGGGGLNGALLRAGLVDELEVVILPVAIGGMGIPSVFDSEPLSPEEMPTTLSLTTSRVTADGAVWLSYDVRPTSQA